MIDIQTVEHIDRNGWNDLLAHSSTASYFQSPECYDFYQSLSFLEPFGFGVYEEGGLKGLVMGYVINDGNRIKRYFSRRAIIPGGALFSDDISDDSVNELLYVIKKYLKKKVIYVEFRNYNNYNIYKELFKKNGFCYNAHLNFHIATPNPETALKNLSSSKRRDVKLSLKEGAEIVEIRSNKEIKEFYNLLYDLYKTKIKTPVFPVEFFEKLILISSGKVIAIKYQNQIIGGSVCVGLENKVLYEWFVCGMDGKFKNIFPSTLATWAAIKFAAENGYQYFDMMGAGKPDEAYGVREFKSKFGGELIENGRFIHVFNKFLFNLGTVGLKIKKKII